MVVATPAEVERAQARLYDPARAPSEDAIDVTQEDLAAASQVVNSMIAGAIEQRASELHIEATERETIVRCRVDGALRQIESRPIELHAAIVSRIKVLSGLDISLHHVPQDGRIKLPPAAGDIDLRISVLPTYLARRSSPSTRRARRRWPRASARCGSRRSGCGSPGSPPHAS